MPSKTSKTKPLPASSWKAAQNCDENTLRSIAAEFSRELRRGDRVFLDGPLGAGKSTFARAILHSLGVQQSAEGSPTFAIAHEYESPRGEVIHIDFYRLRSESEIEDAGITSYYWERDAIVLAEWASLWPNFYAGVIEEPDPKGRTWIISISFIQGSPERRDLVIEETRSRRNTG